MVGVSGAAAALPTRSETPPAHPKSGLQLERWELGQCLVG